MDLILLWLLTVIIWARGDEQGAAPKPCVMIANVTEDGILLKCEVFRTFPKPTLEWVDSDGNTLPADQKYGSEKTRHYYVTILTTVTKHLHCVVKQEDISHMTAAEIYLPSCGERSCSEHEKSFAVKEFVWGIFAGVGIGVLSTLAVGALLAVCGASKYLTKQSNKDADDPPGELLNQTKHTPTPS